MEDRALLQIIKAKKEAEICSEAHRGLPPQALKPAQNLDGDGTRAQTESFGDPLCDMWVFPLLF